MPMALAFQALPPASFYGGQLPRPQLVDEGTLTLTGPRVEPPLTPNGALLEWAADAHWSMGGLSFQRKRMAGKIEGSVAKLRRMAEQVAKTQRKKEEEERERRRGVRKDRSSSMSSKKGRSNGEEDWYDDDEEDVEDGNVVYEEDEKDAGEEVEDDLDEVVEEEVAEEEIVEEVKSMAAKRNTPSNTPERRKLAAEVDDEDNDDDEGQAAQADDGQNTDDDDVVEAEVAEPKRASTRRRMPGQRTSAAGGPPDGRRQIRGRHAALLNTPKSGHRGSPVTRSLGVASSSPARSSRPSMLSAGGSTVVMQESASASPFTPRTGIRVRSLQLAPIMLQDSVLQHLQSPEAVATKQRGRLHSPTAAVLQQHPSPMVSPPESVACQRRGAGLKRDLAAAFDLVGLAPNGSAVVGPEAVAGQQGSAFISSPRRVLRRSAPQKKREDGLRAGLALGEPVEVLEERSGKASRLRQSARSPAVRA